MKSKLWSQFTGQSQVRIRIMWMVVFSFIITFTISVFIPYEWFVPLNIVVFLAGFLFLYTVISRPIVHYLSDITDGVMKIAGGDLSYRIPILREDELGTVAVNINHMADQLQERISRERELEQAKMELITYVSHDLRTPLTSIIGYLDLLNSRKVDDAAQQERYLEGAINKTQQLKTLIDDLFEYTRLTYGETRLSIQLIDVNSLLEQMLSEFESVAMEQGVSIRKLSTLGPVTLEVDAEKIVRAIDNLLMNALKFSYQPGEIVVSLSEHVDEIMIQIENEGKPISKEQEERLFDRFYRLEPVRADTYMPSGSGLGLAITRHIVEMHEGGVKLLHNNGHYQVLVTLKKKHDSAR
ncbi:HAMP domain-containing histidine kinase [Paenibacillus sp. N1-5-1-14]|uniref:sensor histidine kinase n=1 Tax=Paenibacillus radicibacter TaxID=2972488 RepID=UPI002158A9FF|nr:HAMP domain-containing sensor histidine kinase [Paenibacillus radicibacter]MCR8644521.1 HAMP domain-containing histidine kinase [Paenibacillus radicibacter]